MNAKQKSKNNVVLLDDFFGETKDYYLYAVQTDSSLMSLAAVLKEILNDGISYIGDFCPSEEISLPRFPVFHTSIVCGDTIDFFLLENKTLRFNQSAIPFVPDKENPFPTMTLFEEYFYIFNVGRLFLYKWKLADIPFLFLFSVSKGTNVTSFVRQLSGISKTHISNMSEMLESASKQTLAIKNMYCHLEMMASQAAKCRVLKSLSGSVELPTVVGRRYEEVPYNVKINSAYIKMLQADLTFERFQADESC